VKVGSGVFREQRQPLLTLFIQPQHLGNKPNPAHKMLWLRLGERYPRHRWM